MNAIGLNKNRQLSQRAYLRRQTEANRANQRRSRLLLWFATLGLGCVFFLTDHNMQVTPPDEALDQLESGSRMRQIGFMSVGLLGCLLLALRRGRRFAFNSSLAGVLSIYLGLCLASVIWANHTEMSAKRILVSLLCFLAVLGICRHFSPRDLCKSVLMISLTYLCIGIVAELAGVASTPNNGENRFGGTLHMNAQAVNCAYLSISAACLLRDATRWRWALKGIIGVGLVCLLLTGSRGALYSLLLASGAYWWLTSSGHKRALGLTIVPALVTLFVLISHMFGTEPDQFMDITQLGRDRASVSTLTGRLPLWTALLGYIEARPLFGYGYLSFWSVDRYAEIAGSWDWIPTHAHSAYFDITLGLGLTGISLYMLAILIGIYRANEYHALTGDAGYRFILIVMLMVPFYSLAESRYASPSCLYSTIFFYGLFFLAFCADPVCIPARRNAVFTRSSSENHAPLKSNV